MSKTNTENSTITFNLATILHDIKADKYTKEIKETFSIEDASTNEKFRIPKEKVLEIAKCIKDDEPLSYLVNNGYPAGEKMKAGSGLAVKWYLPRLLREWLSLPWHRPSVISTDYAP
jgi:hypothetical protein